MNPAVCADLKDLGIIRTRALMGKGTVRRTEGAKYWHYKCCVCHHFPVNLVQYIYQWLRMHPATLFLYLYNPNPVLLNPNCLNPSTGQRVSGNQSHTQHRGPVKHKYSLA